VHFIDGRRITLFFVALHQFPVLGRLGRWRQGGWDAGTHAPLPVARPSYGAVFGNAYRRVRAFTFYQVGNRPMIQRIWLHEARGTP